jgi:hypothetical protein
MTSPFPTFSPLPASEFKGRSSIIQTVCDQLDHKERRSTALVGGPYTGVTSLLRYLTSKEALDVYPKLANSWNIYIQGDALGLTTTPAHFWAACFREIQRQVDPGPLKAQVLDMVEKTKNNKFDLFSLEDFFDACGGANQLVVLFVDDFINLLRNENFWPPNDFFHQVRSLGQRTPRALSFVVGTPRPLIDFWDPSKNASPFYNIFLAVSIGRLTPNEVKSIVQDGFAALGLTSNADIEALVLKASGKHPVLVNYVADLCAQMIKADGQVDVAKLYQAFGDPAGAIVGLIRRIREQLPITERNWLDLAQENPEKLSETQMSMLRKLWEYGLVPPGVNIA